MALTFVDVKLINPADYEKTTSLQFRVDSGAVYSVVPKRLLKKMGIQPHSTRVFTLANGETISRKLGDVVFDYHGERGAAPVIFGEKGDSVLLGAVTLEALGLILDPLRREIKPLPMVLGGFHYAPKRERRERQPFGNGLKRFLGRRRRSRAELFVSRAKKSDDKKP